MNFDEFGPAFGEIWLFFEKFRLLSKNLANSRVFRFFLFFPESTRTEGGTPARESFRSSDFVLGHSFGFGHSSFVIPPGHTYQSHLVTPSNSH